MLLHLVKKDILIAKKYLSVFTYYHNNTSILSFSVTTACTEYRLCSECNFFRICNLSIYINERI